MWFYSSVFWGMYASEILPMCESARHAATIFGQAWPYCHSISKLLHSTLGVKLSMQFPVPSHKKAKQELATHITTHVTTSPDEESPEHEDFQALCTLLLLIYPYQNHPQYSKGFKTNNL